MMTFSAFQSGDRMLASILVHRHVRQQRGKRCLRHILLLILQRHSLRHTQLAIRGRHQKIETHLRSLARRNAVIPFQELVDPWTGSWIDIRIDENVPSITFSGSTHQITLLFGFVQLIQSMRNAHDWIRSHHTLAAQLQVITKQDRAATHHQHRCKTRK